MFSLFPHRKKREKVIKKFCLDYLMTPKIGNFKFFGRNNTPISDTIYALIQIYEYISQHTSKTAAVPPKESLGVRCVVSYSLDMFFCSILAHIVPFQILLLFANQYCLDELPSIQKSNTKPPKYDADLHILQPRHKINHYV